VKLSLFEVLNLSMEPLPSGGAVCLRCDFEQCLPFCIAIGLLLLCVAR